ncbi:Mediator of RNA polymerase II transcription subunit 21 [Mycena venus]|uniref:Mediator of RNA polymerase II transcription subunit 21 n=1 Tax=Mycena venus TaxID=2733690 RepID=A0A8H6XEC8_9AGAR|nr:Mediator of RNA polymerase II transcription subunit 21 [Mycena venus]
MLQELSHMDRITQLQDEIQQLLTIMSSTIAYLTSRANFVQVSQEIPITKQRNPENVVNRVFRTANKKELVTDLIVKAKQVEYLIKSLPEPEPEEEQAKRLQILDEEMTVANEEYIQAVARSSKFLILHRYLSFFVLLPEDLHAQITGVLRLMLEETETGLAEKPHSR